MIEQALIFGASGAAAIQLARVLDARGHAIDRGAFFTRGLSITNLRAHAQDHGVDVCRNRDRGTVAGTRRPRHQNGSRRRRRRSAVGARIVGCVQNTASAANRENHGSNGNGQQRTQKNISHCRPSAIHMPMIDALRVTRCATRSRGHVNQWRYGRQAFIEIRKHVSSNFEALSLSFSLPVSRSTWSMLQDFQTRGWSASRSTTGRFCVTSES